MQQKTSNVVNAAKGYYQLKLLIHIILLFMQIQIYEKSFHINNID